MGNTTSTFFPANQTASTSFQQQQQSSRRAPVMGNRGLESQRMQHERSRTKTKPSSKESSKSRGSPRSTRKQLESGGQVVALDERNLKRAVNRYGTMPKGARIGAYLESLRVSGMTPEPVTEQGVESDAMVDQSHTSESMDRSMVGKPSKANQMLRSNSSHGGFSSSNGVSKSSPSNSLVKRVQQGSLERAYGVPVPTSNYQPEFEFPPPPVDLPPPSPSPRTAKRALDKENLPERLERNSKTLIGERFKEVSSDSCESLGNPLKSSPMSPVSENRTLGSPAVGSLSSPGSTLDHDHKRNASKSDPDAIKPFQSEKIKRNMEAKLNASEGNNAKETSPVASAPADMLVNELFESFKAKSNKSKPKVEVSTTNANLENVEEKPIDFKANLRKVKKPDPEVEQAQKQEGKANQIDFKSNLKKKASAASSDLVTSTPTSSSSKPDQEPAIVDFKAKLRKSTKPLVTDNAPVTNTNKDETNEVDFKSRLRKISDPKEKSSSPVKESLPEGNNGKRESFGSVETDPDDKRKSTGSISSLRKMWESSPKPGQADEQDKNASVVKFEKRVWPPVPNTETEKPMVPVKPTVKPPAPTTKPPPPKEPMVKPPPKPAMAVKPNVCNIYAAPTMATTRANNAKPPIASRPPGIAKTSAPPPAPTAAAEIPSHSGSGSGCSSSETSDKEELLGISLKLETSIDAAKTELSKSKLLKLSDDIGTFAESASGYVDNVPATGRFRFRSLLNKLEQQSGELRSNSVGKLAGHHSDIPAKLCGDIQATVRDLVTVIQR